MLRITTQLSSAAAKSYYSTADYFTEGQEIQGVWQGRGAVALGLSGTIHQKDWDALCENRDPRSGDKLTARTNHQRRVGWDFTFSVPKSLSVLQGLTGDQHILDAFNEAVDETMLDIEREIKTRVRAQRADTDRVTGNAVWGKFVHLTSRPVDGVPDPQIHAHCFLFNATFDGEESRWKAAQIGDIKRDANYFNALMHSRLAAKLVRMGIPIERTAKGWGIKGLLGEAEAKFSRRTAQIEEIAKEKGIVDPKQKAELGATTREGKNTSLTMESLRKLWLERLTAEESNTILQLAGAVAPLRSPFDSLSEAKARHAVTYAAEHHFERDSVVPQRTLLTTALNHAIGESTDAMVLDAFAQDTSLIRAEYGRRPMATSPAVLDEEGRMIAFARDGQRQCAPLVPSPVAIRDGKLNAGQRRAVEMLCGSGNRVMVVRGPAGTGKTSMTREAVNHIEEAGTRVFLFAPSSDAAHIVLRQEEGFAEAQTIAYLLANPDAQAAVKDAVIWIDEAGLIGTRTMARVFKVAEEQNARVVLMGDSKQHRAVERGKALRILSEEAGLRSAELDEIVRQKDQYRSVVASLKNGDVDAGLKKLDDLQWIREVPDADMRHDRIAAEYVQARSRKESVLIVSPTHAEADQVTTSLRLAIKHEGWLGQRDRNVMRLAPKRLTAAQKRDAVHYQNGDVLVFTQNARGFRKGTRLRVGVDAIPITQSDRYEVFSPQALPVAEGELLRITMNTKSLEGKRLYNGQVCTVKAIADDGTMTLGNGQHIGPEFGHLDLGYVRTSHSSQGKTVDRVIVAQSSHSAPAASAEQFYVSVSRGRRACSVYTDDKEALAEAIMRSEDAPSATQFKRSLNHHRTQQAAAYLGIERHEHTQVIRR